MRSSVYVSFLIGFLAPGHTSLKQNCFNCGSRKQNKRCTLHMCLSCCAKSKDQCVLSEHINYRAMYNIFAGVSPVQHLVPSQVVPVKEISTQTTKHTRQPIATLDTASTNTNPAPKPTTPHASGHRQLQPPVRPNTMEFVDFLSRYNLEQYESVLKRNGFLDIESLALLSEPVLLKMGITLLAHRLQFVNAIEFLNRVAM